MDKARPKITLAPNQRRAWVCQYETGGYYVNFKKRLGTIGRARIFVDRIDAKRWRDYNLGGTSMGWQMVPVVITIEEP